MEITFKKFLPELTGLCVTTIYIFPLVTAPDARSARGNVFVSVSQQRDAVRKKISLVVDAGKTGLHHFSRGDLAMRRSEGSKFARGVIPILQDV